MKRAARRTRLAVALSAALLASSMALLSSCRRPSSPAGGAEPVAIAQRRAPPADSREVLITWLECEECADDQLEAVVALGEEVVPLLVATLREGLSPAYRARLERQLRERHAERSRRGRTLPGTGPALDEEAYVAHHMSARAALHQSRAAIALGRIGSEPARAALREALRERPRPGVERAIRSALGERSG